MQFKNKYRFLSNSYPCEIRVELYGNTFTFKSVESAFYALKDPTHFPEFEKLDGARARKHAERIRPNRNWERFKIDTMKKLLYQKFSQPDLAEMLKSVNKPIVYDTKIKDKFWGVFEGRGQNRLGKLLNNIRKKLLKDQKLDDAVPFTKLIPHDYQIALLDNEMSSHSYSAYEELKEENSEAAKAYLKNYYDFMSMRYCFFQHEYSRFITMFYDDVDLNLIYQYSFEVSSPEEQDDVMIFFLSHTMEYFEFAINGDYGDYIFNIDEILDSYLSTFLDYAYPDYQVVYARILCRIGQYIEQKGDYKTAFDVYLTGAELDNDGRQSCFPFAMVANCEYEVGRMLEKGLGVEVDYERAFEYYQRAADNYCQESIPAIGDLYYYGRGVEQSYVNAFYCYVTSGTNHRFPYSNYFLTDEDYDGESDRQEIYKDIVEHLLQIEDKDYLINVLLAIAYSSDYYGVESDSERFEEYKEKTLELFDDFVYSKYSDNVDKYLLRRLITVD